MTGVLWLCSLSKANRFMQVASSAQSTPSRLTTDSKRGDDHSNEAVEFVANNGSSEDGTESQAVQKGINGSPSTPSDGSTGTWRQNQRLVTYVMYGVSSQGVQVLAALCI